ncbi:MAG TPA: transporter [Galbitalea sp.]
MTAATARIPLNTFAIGFGLAGLAEVWDTAGTSLGFPREIGQSFWLAAAIAWVWLIVAHVVRGSRSGDSLAAQLRHPAQGPIASLVPTTAMLLASELLTVSRPAGLALFLVSVTASALFAGWLIGTWLQGGLLLDSIHGGYLLPTVAAGLVGADVAGQAGLTTLGWALFGVGAFFWLVMTVLVVLRLALRPSLPDPLVPTVMILVAPPAVGGIALFSLGGLAVSIGAAMLLGLTVLLVLVQLAFLPRYRRLTFSLGFWSFTFAIAAVLTDGILWLRLTAVAGWQIFTIILALASTALVVAIAIRSLLLVLPVRRERAAEDTLTDADAVDALVP